MFPAVPSFVAPSNDQIAALAQTQLDPDADSGNNAAGPSGFTYFGQFIDHDLTLDTAPPSTAPTEYLPAVLGQAVVDATISGKVKRFYRPLGNGAPYTPVEFSVATFRFGHSEVRKAYEVNEDTGLVPVFSFTEPDLRGGRQLPAGRQIEWGNFFTQLTDPDDADGINLTRKIDTLMSASLFQLPIRGAEATGSNVLAFRTMTRGKFYGLPSGQDVAKAYGVRPIAPAALNLGPGFNTGTPLWYYLLAEAERARGGLTLGPVGGRLVADVLVKVLDMSQSAGHDYAPDLEIDTMSHLLVAACVAEEPDEDE